MNEVGVFITILLLVMGIGLVAAVVGVFLFNKDDWWL